MKKRKNPGGFPVSQREMAAYLKISQSLLSMSGSGKATRTMGAAAAKKLALLMQAHHQPGKPAKGPGLNKMEETESGRCKKSAAKLLSEISYLTVRIPVLRRRLDVMKEKYKQDMEWLRTLEKLLANPSKEPLSKRDELWLENQQIDTLKRVGRNGIEAQVKIQLQIELDTARINAYTTARKQLLKQIRS